MALRFFYSFILKRLLLNNEWNVRLMMILCNSDERYNDNEQPLNQI